MMGSKMCYEDCASDIESWASKKVQKKVGDNLPPESEEQRERRWQKLRILMKGVPSVKTCYTQNSSRQRRPIAACGSGRARMTSGDSEGAQTVSENRDQTIGDDEVSKVSVLRPENNGKQNSKKRGDFRPIVECGRILLFEFLNVVLLVGLLVVRMFGAIVLEAEKQLEEWESYQEYKETLLATREGEVSTKEATTKETRMPMVEAQPSMMPASSSSGLTQFPMTVTDFEQDCYSSWSDCYCDPSPRLLLSHDSTVLYIYLSIAQYRTTTLPITMN